MEYWIHFLATTGSRQASTVAGYVRALPRVLATRVKKMKLQSLPWGDGMSRNKVAQWRPPVLSKAVRKVLANLLVSGTAVDKAKTATSVAKAPPMSIKQLACVQRNKSIARGVRLAVLMIWRLGVRPSTVYVNEYARRTPAVQQDRLHWRDIQLTASHGKRRLVVRVRREKNSTDIYGRAAILVEEVGGPLCLLQLMEAHAYSRHGASLRTVLSTQGAVLHQRDCSDRGVNQALWTVDSSLRIKSLRRGATTLLAEAGVSEKEIMAYGGWRSDAANCYIFMGYHAQPLMARVLTGKLIEGAKPPQQAEGREQARHQEAPRAPRQPDTPPPALQAPAASGAGDVPQLAMLWYDNHAGHAHEYVGILIPAVMFKAAAVRSRVYWFSNSAQPLAEGLAYTALEDAPGAYVAIPRERHHEVAAAVTAIAQRMAALLVAQVSCSVSDMEASLTQELGHE